MVLRKQLNGQYAIKLGLIENTTKELWVKDTWYGTDYTLHGIEHSIAVINKLDQLVVGLGPKDKLTEIEIFCLLSAAYLHDVGMLIPYQDDQEKVKSIQLSIDASYTHQDLIRADHHLRSGSYIKEHYKALGIDHVESECIRLISEGHRKVDLFSPIYEDTPISSETIRVRLLSALLRIADELDIDYRRAPENVYQILTKDMQMPSFSRLQWLRHHYTNGVIIDPHKSGDKKARLITIHTRYPTINEGKQLTEDLIIKPIKPKIKELEKIFLDHGLKFELKYELKVDKDEKEIPKELYDYAINVVNLDESLSNQDDYHKIQGKLLSDSYWGDESDEWVAKFHHNLKKYRHIYAINSHRRLSLDSSRFNRYLREQYIQRLSSLKSNQNRYLSFSEPILKAINKTGWKPNKTMWKGYRFRESNCNLLAELEVVRILIWPIDKLHDPQKLMNLDFDHKIFAIPLFVLDARGLKPSENIDFVIGFDENEHINECYEFELANLKVSYVNLEDSKNLINIFNGMLGNDSLKTVSDFVAERMTL